MSTSAPAPVPQYTIRLRDTSLNPQGALTAWTAGDIVLRMNDVGNWAFTVKADDPLKQYFVPGCGVIITRDRGDGSGAQTLMSGPIWVIDRLGLENYYVLGGPTDDWWLKARSALPQGGRPYMQVVLNDAPIRYVRLDEASGTTAKDVSANNVAGSYSATGVTYGVVGGVPGDPDTGVTLAAATSGKITLSASFLPTGNSAVAFEWLMKITANPGASQYLIGFGNGTNTLRQDFNVFLDTTGHLNLDLGNGTGIATSAALSLNTWHHVVAAWDGTVARLWVDNVQTTNTPGVNQAIVASPNCFLGCGPASTLFANASVDEWAVYAGITAAQVAAHFAAFNTTHGAYDTRTGQASTVLIAYVNANLVAATNIDRNLATLALAADPAVGGTVTGNARWDNLLALLQQLASAGGDIGFKVVQTANGVLTFSVYPPADKTSNAKFSIALENLFDFAYSYAGPLANSVDVLGAGTGAARSVLGQRDATSIALWGLVEDTRDARDTSDTVTMQQRGTADVNAGTSLVNLMLTPRDTNAVQYGRDYNLGDIVAITIDGVTITNKIRSVHIELKSPGDQELVTPAIGNPSQGEIAQWFDAEAIARQQAISKVQVTLKKLSTAQ